MDLFTNTNRKWLGLISLIPALAMIFIDQSVLPVALPTIQKQLNASNIQLEWSVNAYLLALAALVVVGGKIGDRIGHRKAFSLGNGIFLLASILCGLSVSANFLIGSRALQGLGAALMIPASNSLLMTLFPASERGKAAGINVSVSALFMILGPLVGGYLTQEFSWRFIFWINIPVGILGTFLVFLFVPCGHKRDEPLDYLGFFYLVAFSSLLVFAIMQGRDWGWQSPAIVLSFFLSIIAALFLAKREYKSTKPFLELSLFKNRVYTAVNLSVFTLQFVLMMVVYRAIFFQEQLGWSPIQMGAISFFSMLPVVFMPLIVGVLADRLSPKFPIIFGFIVTACSFFWVGYFIESSIPVLFVGLLGIGIGVPSIFTSSYAAAMKVIPLKVSGVAFGTISTIRSLGASLGVAVIGVLLEKLRIVDLKRQVNDELVSRDIDTSIIPELGAASGQVQDLLKGYSNDVQELLIEGLNVANFTSFVNVQYLLGGMVSLTLLVVIYLYFKKGKEPLS